MLWKPVEYDYLWRNKILMLCIMLAELFKNLRDGIFILAFYSAPNEMKFIVLAIKFLLKSYTADFFDNRWALSCIN
jgi:hypothetical protein